MGQERSRLLGAARGKFGYLLLALIVFLATAPVIADSHAWKLVLAGFGSGLLIAGLHAARPGKRSLIVGLVVAAVEFGIGRMGDIHGSRWLLLAQALLWLLAMTYVAFEILENVLGSAEVTLETLQAAFCVYLLLGLIWAFGYALLQIAAPASFQAQHGPPVVWSDAPSRRLGFLRVVIFSYSTLTGTGYGEIAPAPPRLPPGRPFFVLHAAHSSCGAGASDLLCRRRPGEQRFLGTRLGPGGSVYASVFGGIVAWRPGFHRRSLPGFERPDCARRGRTRRFPIRPSNTSPSVGEDGTSSVPITPARRGLGSRVVLCTRMNGHQSFSLSS